MDLKAFEAKDKAKILDHGDRSRSSMARFRQRRGRRLLKQIEQPLPEVKAGNEARQTRWKCRICEARASKVPA